MDRVDAIVIGGGIAGLSLAHALSPRARVVLVEREPMLAAHATGRNAAIFRQLSTGPLLPALAQRTAALLDALVGRQGWLKPTGALYVAADEAPLAPLVAASKEHGVPCERLSLPALVARAPRLESGAAREGLFVPGDGVIDVHAVVEALAASARARGAVLRTGAAALRIAVEGSRAAGAEIDGAGLMRADAVVVAAGAWAAGLGASSGAGLPLAPLRRHLAILDVPARPDEPIVWALDDETYFRPESGGLLASPCDEEPFEPCLPPASPAALEALAVKLAGLAPGLGRSGVRRSWACLRTRAPDHVPVAGRDPRVRGLSWLAGLGGHGMSTGPALGEAAAALVLGDAHPLAQALSPVRLLAAE